MADKKQIVRIKIDCSKIDKARLFKGKGKAQYLDATVFISQEADQYGNNGMITQDVTKEERESGVKGAILGNIKIVGGSKPEAKKASAKRNDSADMTFEHTEDMGSSDDLPF